MIAQKLLKSFLKISLFCSQDRISQAAIIWLLWEAAALGCFVISWRNGGMGGTWAQNKTDISFEWSCTAQLPPKPWAFHRKNILLCISPLAQCCFLCAQLRGSIFCPTVISQSSSLELQSAEWKQNSQPSFLVMEGAANFL